MSRKHRGGAFPYAERAREAREAHAAVRPAFQVMWNGGGHRDDLTDPRTAAWQAAVAKARRALGRAFPSGWIGFGEALEAIRRGKRSGLDEMLAFLEADPRFFRSGYHKEKILRFIKRVPLEPDEAERLRQVVLDIVDRRDGREFRDYCRLARHLATPEFRRELEGRAESADPAIARRAGWVIAALDAGT